MTIAANLSAPVRGSRAQAWRSSSDRALSRLRSSSPIELSVSEEAIAEACRLRWLEEANGLSWLDIWVEFCDTAPPTFFGGDDLVYALAATWTRLPHARRPSYGP